MNAAAAAGMCGIGAEAIGSAKGAGAKGAGAKRHKKTGAPGRGIPVFYNTCFMEEMQHAGRPVLRFFYNFRAYLRSSLPRALRGSGSAVNSTALIRLYSGRVRLHSVIKSFTSACRSSAQ